MKLLNRFLDKLRMLVRSGMDKVARLLNSLSGGHLSPSAVTWTSLLGHIPLAWLIATQHPLKAVLFLVIFGLMDALDGSLARLQSRATASGMLLDATTDRMKEVIIYLGVAYHFMYLGPPMAAVWVVAAVGGSLLVSYVKAKGETAVASTRLDHASTNRLFQDGLMRYEVRMAILVLGLLLGQLLPAVILIALLSWLTAFERLYKISRKLNAES